MHWSACLNLGSPAMSERWLSMRMMCSSLGVPSVLGTGPVMMDT